MGYGTAGLLMGLGNAATSIAKTLEERRIDALKWAQELERERRAEERAERQYTRARTDKVADDQTDRTWRSNEAAADRIFRSTERTGQQQHESSLQDDRQSFEDFMSTKQEGWARSREERNRAYDRWVEQGKPIGEEVDQKTGRPVLLFRGKNGGFIRRFVPDVDARTPAYGSESTSSSFDGPTRGGARGGSAGASAAPRRLTPAEADAFVKNPKNKGKSFIGPDGVRRVVQ